MRNMYGFTNDYLSQIIKTYLSHFKENFSIAFPIIITQLGLIFISISDNLMVGKIGKKAIASVSISNSVFFILIIFGFGLSTSISSLISSMSVKKNYREGSIILYQGLLLGLIFAIAMYGCTHIFLYILPYLGQPKEIYNDIFNILNVLGLSFIPWIIFEILRKFSEGLSLLYPSIVIIWISSFINMVLNYLFINGLFYFPKLGVVGVAYATLISRICMLIGMICVLYINKKTRIYWENFKYLFSFKKEYLNKILKISIPSGLHMLFEIGVFAISSFLSGICGVQVVAAHQIVLHLVSSIFIFNTGFSVAATIRSSHFFALKKYDTVKEIGNSIIFMGSIFIFILSILCFIYRKNLICFYLKNHHDYDIIPIADTMMVIASFSQFFDGIQGIIIGILRGVRDVKIPMLISFFSYWIIALPLSYILSIFINGIGVWIGLSIGILVSFILLIQRYNYIMYSMIKNNINK